MPTVQRLVRIELFGPFAVTDLHGRDLTPRGSKTQALLALLATATSMRRTRAWLQDKLWSDRSERQAAGSLRQSLAELRRSLGDCRDVIIADRAMVALDAARVAVSRREDAGPFEAEFLEGIDVRDPEFEAWLRQMRAGFASPRDPDESPAQHLSVACGPPAASAAVQIVAAGSLGGITQVIARAMVDRLAQCVDHLGGFEVFTIPAPRPAPGLLQITVDATATPRDCTHLRIVIEGASSGRRYWSNGVVLAPARLPVERDIDCLALCHRAVCALSTIYCCERLAIARGLPPAAVVATAVRKMFTMRRDDFREAEGVLRHPVEGVAPGLLAGLRAQAGVIAFTERLNDDTEGLREESEALCAKALELAPGNAVIMASVANARLAFRRDRAAALELSRTSVELDPANPLAWWAYSTALLYGGDAAGGHAAALTSRRVAHGSPLQFWCDFQLALTSAVTGRTTDAIAAAEAASARSPSFRPPLRYLLALYANAGEHGAAARTAERLSALEPDFGLERLTDDPAYPVSLMRDAGLIDRERLKPIWT